MIEQNKTSFIPDFPYSFTRRAKATGQMNSAMGPIAAEMNTVLVTSAANVNVRT